MAEVETNGDAQLEPKLEPKPELDSPSSAPTGTAVSDVLIKAELAELLKTADLSVTTEKQLRKQLEANLECDLTDKKQMIRAEVQAFLDAQTPQEDDEEEEEEEEEEEAPKKKKSGGGRTGSAMGSILSPALQAFLGVETMPRPQVVKAIWTYIKEHNLQNPTNKRKINMDDKLKTIFKPPIDMFSMHKQLSAHCKTAAGVKRKAESDNDDDDDEDDGDEDDEPKPKKAKAPKKAKKNDGSVAKPGGFTKPVKVSEALGEFFGSHDPIPRSDITKKMWDYFKSNGLQDPKDKRIIKCDEKLKALLKVDQFAGFSLQKYLKDHVLGYAD